MPEYHRIIVVDGNCLTELITTFSNLVGDKFYKPVPYKDYTRLRKFNKEVQLRFADDGAVMIVPTEPGLSMLYWTKKGDESLGDFLWGHFQEELEEMHPDKEKKEYYDLFGLISNDCAEVTTAACKSYADVTFADNGSISSLATDKISTTDYCYKINSEDYTTAGTSWLKIDTPIETLSEKLENLEKQVEENQKLIEKKVNFPEMDYNLKCIRDDLYAEIDDVHYQVRELAEEVVSMKKKMEEKEMKVKEAAEDKRASSGIVFDMYGMPHEVQGTSTLQSTSAPYYPARNYKINFKADYMSGSDNGKEKENMDTAKMFNFDFGPVASHIRMSPYGLAMKNADGKYVSYDKTTGSVMDVEIFNFDAQKFLYKMPVAVSQVAVGDIVVHMRKPMFVRAVKDGVVSVIDIYNAEAKDILPVKSPFGFNFITKVVSLIDMTGADANSPFGNMLPLLMMGEGQDFKDILPLMLFANSGNANMFGNMAQNPLMLYALMGDKNNIDPLAMAVLMGGFAQAPAAPAHNCGCQNHNPEGQCNNG